MKFAYSTNAYTRWSLDRAVEDIRVRGFDGVEILADIPHAFPDGRVDAAALRGRLRAAGLGVSNLNGNTSSGLDREGRDPSGFWPGLADPVYRPLKVDYVRRVIDLARALGADTACTASGPLPPGTTEAAAWDALRRSVDEILLHAAKGPPVRLGIEYEPGFLVGDRASALRLLRETDHPLLGVNLDLGHAACAGEDPAETVLVFAGRTWNLHLEDIKGRVHDHLVPGRGDLDFAAIGRALRKTGYDRYVTLELYPCKDDPGGAGEEGLKHVRSLMATPSSGR